MPGMKLPYFENEAVEAQWRYDHREEVSEHLLTALREGRVGEGSAARSVRKWHEAEAAKAASGLPAVPVEDVQQHSSE